MGQMADGCTGFPDIVFGISIKHCCDTHDIVLGKTLNWANFDRANVDFAHCIWDTGLWWCVLPCLFAVSTFGTLLFIFGKKENPDPSNEENLKGKTDD